ncbi:MAG: hypothetical protein KDK90_01850 [Leptospiraceae bacterium]|nr:hypothetical protein [Leptospiraceae bacterium]
MKGKLYVFIPVLLFLATISCGGAKKKSNKKAEVNQNSGPKYMDYSRVYLGQNGMLYTIPMQQPQKSIETIVLDRNEKKLIVVPVVIEENRNTNVYPNTTQY